MHSAFKGISTILAGIICHLALSRFIVEGFKSCLGDVEIFNRF